jgi:hypothetical protein
MAEPRGDPKVKKMGISSIGVQPPVLPPTTSGAAKGAATAPKPEVTAASAGADSDGDNDGSGVGGNVDVQA